MFTRLEYGYKLVCAEEQEGHEDHDTLYSDYDRVDVSPWGEDDFRKGKLTGYVNGHLSRLVVRNVTYGDWEEVN